MISRLFLRGVLACAAGLFFCAASHAQAFRTYLSPTGLDTNPCSLVAPCRLLPAALAAVADGGEVWMLASGSYNTGPVDVTKSVTVLAVPGALGHLAATGGGNAINIATPGVRVVVRNLMLVGDPGGGSNVGILMTAGHSLTVENCLITNMRWDGIQVNAPASLRVTDTTIRDSGYGMFILNGARATVTRAVVSGNVMSGIQVTGNIAGSLTTADIADSTITDGFLGVNAWSSNASAEVRVSLVNSRASGTRAYGVRAVSSFGANVTLSVAGNVVSYNERGGISAEGLGSRIFASRNSVIFNFVALSNLSGLFETAGDNVVTNFPSSAGVVGAIPKM